MTFQHYYKNVPVYDNYYNIHLADSIPLFCSGKFANISGIANAVNIKLEDAVEIGVSKSKENAVLSPKSKKGELILFRVKDTEPYKYVYKVEVIYADATKSKELMIDAATGEVLTSNYIVCNVNTPGSGDTRYSGTQNITGDSFAGGFRLREDNSGVAVSTLNNQNQVEINNPIDFVDNDNTWTAAEHGNNRPALDVHWASERYLDYFRTTFSRNGFDNNNFPVTSYVHRFRRNPTTGLDEPMDNAFWNPNDRTLSFGDGLFIFSPLTSLDVVGHEMGHGFAFFEVGFNTTGEAGSLNEGFSDIWGAVVEGWAAPAKNRWIEGEEIMANGFSCLRSLRAPNTEGFRNGFFTEGNYPDTRLGNFWDANNADPHINATVLGHWFFRLSEGGSGTTDFGNAFNVGTGVGIQTASQIAYNTELALTPAADFMEVRIQSIQYASNQWGANSCEAIAVTNAWFAVGVGPAYSGTAGLSINGDDIFCTTSNNYTIPNLPAGATVLWEVLPQGIATPNNPNSTQTTITKNSNGIVTLRATISNVCGTQFTFTKNNIVVGSPSIRPLVTDIEPCGYYLFATTTDVPGAYKYYWDLDGYEMETYQPYLSIPQFPALAGQPNFPLLPGNHILKVRVENQCGISTYPVKPPPFNFSTITCSPPQRADQEDSSYTLTATPNPASYAVNVELVSKDSKAKDESYSIQKIVLRDKIGNVKKQYDFKNKGLKQVIDISFLPNDIYAVSVFNGHGWQTIKLMVVH